MLNSSRPVEAGNRIPELDAIRGFALFGVLWMNLAEMRGLVVPANKVINLAPPMLERTVEFVSGWLMHGKAQALFSMLFGLGFALFLERAKYAGRDGYGLYARRLSFLLLLGLAHAMFLYAGDILKDYALMGFGLIFTQRWRGSTLIFAGLLLSVGAFPVAALMDWILHPGQPPSWVALARAEAIRYYTAVHAKNYVGVVVENWRTWYTLVCLTPVGFAYYGWILGRFFVGAWLFRQGWLSHTDRYRRQFLSWSPILLTAGLSSALIGPALGALNITVGGLWVSILALIAAASAMVLALGYAALIVALHTYEPWRRAFSGLGAVGRMALTNYLVQSLLFFFVLDDFGLGLVRYVGPMFCLVSAVLVFGLQVLFSTWWLGRFRFGPVEWLWRSFTYGARQQLRRAVTPSSRSASSI